jgi:hypothetical protein
MAREALQAAGRWVSAQLRRVKGRLAPVARRWWRNPLLHHARRSNPLPLERLRVWVPAAAGALAVLALAAWLGSGLRPLRMAGSALVGLGLGLALLPVLAAPVAAADGIVRQMRRPRMDPRRLDDLPAIEVAWGLGLASLWRLRWLIVLAAAATPLLAVSVLRLDISDFAAWRQSAQALGGTTEASRAVWLLPDGRVPYFRLAARAISGALLPWALLPLMAAQGVTFGLLLDDISLSPLAALLAGAAVTIGVGLGWQALSLTPWLAGPFELLRLLLVGGLLALPGLATHWLNQYNGRRLFQAPRPVEPEVEAGG